MKSFDHFVAEASDEQYYDERIKQRLDERNRKARRKGASTSFKRAMAALSKGDTQRHRYWLSKAYHSLTGTQEE